MKFRMNLLIAASALALAAGPAFADHHEKGEGKKMTPAEKFAAMDADENGSLTKDEVKAHLEKKGKETDKLDEKFAKLDSDENGEISAEEWEAAHAEKKEEKKEEGGEEKKDDSGE